MKALSTLYSRHRAGVLAALAAGLCLVLAALLWPVSYTHLTLPTKLEV